MFNVLLRHAANIHKQNPFKVGLVLRYVDSLFVKAWNNALYPIVLGYCALQFGNGAGLILGSAIMTVASTLLCLAYLAAYNHWKYDIWGLEAEKGIVKRYTGTDLSELVTTSKLWALGAILVLPVLTDPFLTIARLRPRNEYRMEAADWIVFSASVILGNVLWSLWMSVVVLVLLWTVETFKLTQDQIVVLASAAVLVLVIILFPSQRRRQEKFPEF